MKALHFASLLLLAAAAALIVAGGAAASPAGAQGSSLVGHVYVNDNTAPVNTVAGFDRHADGTLTPIPGSPFAVGGRAPGTRTPRRARCSSAPTAAISSRSTPAATRSRC